MNFKVLIRCLVLCGLIFAASGTSEDALDANNISNVANLETESEQQFEADAAIRQGTAHELKTNESSPSGARNDPHKTTGSNQHTTDGRIGKLEMSQDTPMSVDIIWKIPNFLTLPYRSDAGIISPDFSYQGFRGYFVMDPNGSISSPGVINFKSLIVRSHYPVGETYLRVFLKARDATFQEYAAKVALRNYFTCHVPKLDIVNNKESMVPGGVLTVLFRLKKEDDDINRNSDESPSLASMYGVGDLQARQESSSKSVVTWKFKDFFSLPEFRQLTGSLPEFSPYFVFHIYLTPKGKYDEVGLSRLQFSWRYDGDDLGETLGYYPKLFCKFSLKTVENTLYNITGEQYHVAKKGGFCRSLIPWSEMFERKDFLVPGGELTLVLKIDSKPDKIVSEAQADPHQTTENVSTTNQLTTDGRIGEMELSEDTPTSVDVTWKIPNFFLLPYRTDAGILSPDFSSQVFKGYFVMNPKGSPNTPGVINFKSLIVREGYPDKRTYFRLFLKPSNGTLKEYYVTATSMRYFRCDVPKVDINDNKETMVPGGVLTVLFRLSEETNDNRNIKEKLDFGSLHDIGNLTLHSKSSSQSIVTWRFNDFFSLPEHKEISKSLPEFFPYFVFYTYIQPMGYFSDEAGYTHLRLNWMYFGNIPPEILIFYPKFFCEFSIMTSENILHRITEEKYDVGARGGSCKSRIAWSDIYERKDSFVPGGNLTVFLKFGPEERTTTTDELDEISATTESNILSEARTDAQQLNGSDYFTNRNTTDGRIGRLMLSQDTPISLNISWTIPNILTLPYRTDAGILSPDFRSKAFKGYFVMDPKGSISTPGLITFKILIIRRDHPVSQTYLQVFMKTNDGTLKEYAAKVAFNNYFTCDVPKLDIIDKKESVVPGGTLTMLFRLIKYNHYISRNFEERPSREYTYGVGEVQVHPESSSQSVVTWTFKDFYSIPEFSAATEKLFEFSPYFVFRIFIKPKETNENVGLTLFEFEWEYKDNVPSEKLVLYPKFSCRFALKTVDNTLYNITGEEYRVLKQEGFCFCYIPWSQIFERKDFLVPGGELTFVLNIQSESENEPFIVPETMTDPNQLIGNVSVTREETTDGRIGELELFEDTPTSVDVTWKIPNVLRLPYRPDAGIISPDFSSQGFKGYFIMDPNGSMSMPGMINFKSLIICHDHPYYDTYLKVFLKTNDSTLKDYSAKVALRNYFTCDVPKDDIVKNKESMIPEGVLTVLFRLNKEENATNRNTEESPSLSSMNDVGDLQVHPESSSKSVMTWKFKEFFSLPEFRKLTWTLPEISPYFFFHIYMTPKGTYDEAGLTRFQLNWRYKGDMPRQIFVEYPKFSCNFSLKSSENTLYNMTGDRIHVAEQGGSCSCLIPWSKIFERKNFLVPAGELTFVLEVDSESKLETFTVPETETETFQTPESVLISDPPPLTMEGRIGELHLSQDTPTSVNVTWKIPDFLTMVTRDGVYMSPQFSSQTFNENFFTVETFSSGVIKFTSSICPRSNDEARVSFNMFLKAKDGTLKECEVMGASSYYACYFHRSLIVDQEEKLLSDSVLSVLYRLSIDVTERDPGTVQ